MVKAIKTASVRKRFVIREFWRYFALMLLPLFLTEPVILYNTWQEIEEGIASQNRLLLEQTKDILEDMQQNVNHISLYFSQNMQVGHGAKMILNRKTLDADMMDSINGINQYLQNMQNTNTSIDSIYIYFDNDYGRFFSSRSGICRIQGFYDITWLKEYLNSDRDIWYSSHSIQEYDFAEAVPVVTVCRKLYSSSGEESDGVVALNYRADRLKEDINRLSLYDNQTILLLDQDQQILLTNRETHAESVQAKVEGLSREEADAGKDYRTFRMDVDGRSFSVSVMYPSLHAPVAFLSMLPFRDLYRQLIVLGNVAGASLIAALVISIFLAWRSAKRDMIRLNDVIALLDHEAQPAQIRREIRPDSGNLYDHILFNVLQLFLEQDYLKMQYSEQKYKMEVLNLQALQHQINPHFMNNTLNSIYWEAIRLKGGINSCSDMVEKLSAVMRYAIESSVTEVTVQEEMDYLDIYQDIQSARYQRDLHVSWDVDGDSLKEKVLKMVLQPLVENAVYHGIKEKQFQGSIRCRIRKEEGHLDFQVVDTGMGVPKEKAAEICSRLMEREDPEAHVGLYNTNLRLILRYGEEARISFRSKYGMGTVIRFRIPCNEVTGDREGER